MAKHFLKAQTTFSCPYGAKFLASQSSGKAVCGEMCVLTTKASLKPLVVGFPCTVLTPLAPANICGGQLVAGWMEPDAHVTNSGAPLLTNTSYKICQQALAAGQRVQVKCDQPVEKLTDVTKSASVAAIASLVLPQPVTHADASQSSPAASDSPSAVSPDSGAPAKGEDASRVAPKETKKKEKPSFDKDDQFQWFCETSSKDCTKEKWETCPYRKAEGTAQESQPVKLRSNYERLHREADERQRYRTLLGDAEAFGEDVSDRTYEARRKNLRIFKDIENGKEIRLVYIDEDGIARSIDDEEERAQIIEDACDEIVQEYWTFAAHHILSTNQIFATFPALVKLANAYKERVDGEEDGDCVDFDINGGWNCIMLPSVTKWQKEPKEDDPEKEAARKKRQTRKKNASAFDVMSLVGLQWHLGNHGYELSEEEQKLLKQQMPGIGPAVDLKNYADAVKELLRKKETSMKTHRCCRNTVAQKRAFLRWMMRLAQSIKATLCAFAADPKQSYPFYVSAEAYKFAFSIPVTTKIAVFRREGWDTLLCQTFRVPRVKNRRESDENGEFLFKETQPPLRLSWQHAPDGRRQLSPDERRQIIAYLGNVQYFVLANRLAPDMFSFLLLEGEEEDDHFLRLSDALVRDDDTVDDLLKQNEGNIGVWLRDVRPYEGSYVSPHRMIYRRLQQNSLVPEEGTAMEAKERDPHA